MKQSMMRRLQEQRWQYESLADLIAHFRRISLSQSPPQIKLRLKPNEKRVAANECDELF